jgi:hypothetical protein
LELTLARWSLPGGVSPLAFQVIQEEKLQHQKGTRQHFLGESNKHQPVWFTLKNSSSFGSYSMMSTLEMMFPTPSIGNSRIMESIPPLWHTRCNLKGLSQPLLMLPFEKCGHLQNTNYLHGWLDKIEFGRRIGDNKGVGKIVEIVHFATMFKN